MSHYKDPSNIIPCYVKIANGSDAIVRKDVEAVITWYNSQPFIRKNKLGQLRQGLQPECNQNSAVVTVDNTGPVNATSFLGNFINIGKSWLNTDEGIPLSVGAALEEFYESITDSDDRDGVYDPQKPLVSLHEALLKKIGSYYDIKDLEPTEFGKVHMAVTDQMPTGMKFRIE